MRKQKDTTEIGYLNCNGQVVVRATGLPGTDNLQYIYQLACTGCGENYGANGSDIFQRKCPACQSGEPGLPYDTGPASNEAELLIYGEVQDMPLFLPIGTVAWYVRVQYAIRSSKNWAEFIKRLPEGEWDRLLENLEIDDAVTFEQYCKKKKLDPEAAASRSQFMEDEDLELRVPLPDEGFDPCWINGYEDGDWPGSYWSDMLAALPERAIAACGGTQYAMMGGFFPNFHTEKLPMLKSLLQQGGFRCMQWQELVEAAAGQLPDSVEDDHFFWLVRRAENLATKARWFKRTETARATNAQ
jgi:hypothetical protein